MKIRSPHTPFRSTCASLALGMAAFIGGAISADAQSYRLEIDSAEFTPLEGPSLKLPAGDVASQVFGFGLGSTSLEFFGRPISIDGFNNIRIFSNGTLRIDDGERAAVVSALAFDQYYAVDTNSVIVFDLAGGGGQEMVFKFEWRNVRTGPEPWRAIVNPQIWIYQESGIVECRYGETNESTDSSLGGFKVGLLSAPSSLATVDDVYWLEGRSGEPSVVTTVRPYWPQVQDAPTPGRVFRFIPNEASGVAPEATAELIRAWPNPTTGLLRLSGLSSDATLMVHDMLGRAVMGPKGAGPDAVVDMTPLPSGAYTLTVTGPGGSRTLRVIRR